MKLFFSVLMSLFLLLPVHAQPVEFAMHGLDGKLHKLSDYRGKWVVVNYWATWCPPCAEEIPELNKFYNKYKGNKAAVIGINFEFQDKDYVREFINEFDLKYPVLMTEETISTPFGQLAGLPTTYLISPDGELQKTHMGVVSLELLENWMQGKLN